MKSIYRQTTYRHFIGIVDMSSIFCTRVVSLTYTVFTRESFTYINRVCINGMLSSFAHKDKARLKLVITCDNF